MECSPRLWHNADLDLTAPGWAQAVPLVCRSAVQGVPGSAGSAVLGSVFPGVNSGPGCASAALQFMQKVTFVCNFFFPVSVLPLQSFSLLRSADGSFLLVILEIVNKFCGEVTSITRERAALGRSPSSSARALL